MNDEQAKRLRELAERATPGPWVSETDSVHAYAHTVADAMGWPFKQRGKDAAYIAAASPDVVTALLDERDALRQSIARHEARRMELADLRREDLAQLDALRRERDNYRTDATTALVEYGTVRSERDAALAVLRRAVAAMDEFKNDEIQLWQALNEARALLGGAKEKS